MHSRSEEGSPARKPRILFLHANGYPSGVYRQFFDELRPHFVVDSLEVIDTPVDCPPARRWHHMRDQVLQRLEQMQLRGEAPDLLVGHSMGGYLALLAGPLRPRHARPVVLVDSPIVEGWRSALLSTVQRSGLMRYSGLVRMTMKRRHEWPDLATARAHFEPKHFTRHWAPGVLDDYLHHALEGHPGPLRLRIRREAEGDIYATLAHRQSRAALKRLRAAGIKVALVYGRHSAEMRMAGMRNNERRFGDAARAIDSGHLIPQEKPRECAQAIRDIATRVFLLPE